LSSCGLSEIAPSFECARTSAGCNPTACQFNITSSDVDINIVQLKVNYKF